MRTRWRNAKRSTSAFYPGDLQRHRGNQEEHGGLARTDVQRGSDGSAELSRGFPRAEGGRDRRLVTDGRITRAGETQARLLRDNVVVFEGKIPSLRRFKDDESEA